MCHYDRGKAIGKERVGGDGKKRWGKNGKGLDLLRKTRCYVQGMRKVSHQWSAVSGQLSMVRGSQQVGTWQGAEAQELSSGKRGPPLRASQPQCRKAAAESVHRRLPSAMGAGRR